jgi:hypothetical protein
MIVGPILFGINQVSGIVGVVSPFYALIKVLQGICIISPIAQAYFANPKVKVVCSKIYDVCKTILLSGVLKGPI